MFEAGTGALVVGELVHRRHVLDAHVVHQDVQAPKVALHAADHVPARGWCAGSCSAAACKSTCTAYLGRPSHAVLRLQRQLLLIEAAEAQTGHACSIMTARMRSTSACIKAEIRGQPQKQVHTNVCRLALVKVSAAAVFGNHVATILNHTAEQPLQRQTGTQTAAGHLISAGFITFASLCPHLTPNSPSTASTLA